jgi:hypothetical protein
MKIRVRTLHIGAREFRWAAELCPYYDLERDYHRCVRVRVWGGGKNSRKLCTDLESTDPGPWGGVPDSSYPTPQVVRMLIDYALEHGWDPSGTSGRYELSAGEGPEIPGFQVTDRLRMMQHLRY